MVGRHRIAVDSVVESIDGSERRRVAVAAGVPVLFVLVVELGANLGVLPLVVAGALAVYLYTRETGQALLAASAYGTGLLLVGVFVHATREPGIARGPRHRVGAEQHAQDIPPPVDDRILDMQMLWSHAAQDAPQRAHVHPVRRRTPHPIDGPYPCTGLLVFRERLWIGFGLFSGHEQLP
jgi:hypothetical protein